MPQRMPEFRRPADVNQAAALLRQPGLAVRPLGLTLRPPALSQIDSDILLDLRHLNLEAISADERLIRIGAQALVQALTESAVIRSYAGGLLSEAARIAAPLTVRNTATVGAAFTAVDGPPEVKLALLVLDVVAEYDETGQLLLCLSMPVAPAPGLGAALERVARAPRDEAIVAAAARLRRQGGVVRAVRLAVAGATPQPRRFESVEAWLEGQALGPEALRRVEEAVAAEADPVADLRAGVDYRRAMAGVLAARALATAMQRAA